MPLTLRFATDFTSVGPRLLHYEKGQYSAVVQKPLTPDVVKSKAKAKDPKSVPPGWHWRALVGVFASSAWIVEP